MPLVRSYEAGASRDWLFLTKILVRAAFQVIAALLPFGALIFSRQSKSLATDKENNTVRLRSLGQTTDKAQFIYRRPWTKTFVVGINLATEFPAGKHSNTIVSTRFYFTIETETNHHQNVYRLLR
jgi:hypothetical protein